MRVPIRVAQGAKAFYQLFCPLRVEQGGYVLPMLRGNGQCGNTAVWVVAGAYGGKLPIDGAPIAQLVFRAQGPLSIPHGAVVSACFIPRLLGEHGDQEAGRAEEDGFCLFAQVLQRGAAGQHLHGLFIDFVTQGFSQGLIPRLLKSQVLGFKIENPPFA